MYMDTAIVTCEESVTVSHLETWACGTEAFIWEGNSKNAFLPSASGRTRDDVGLSLLQNLVRSSKLKIAENVSCFKTFKT